MPKPCSFADPLLTVSYGQGVLLIIFFHNKAKPLHDMLLSLHNRNSREVYWKQTKQTKPSTLLKIRHEEVWNEKSECLEMRAWWEFGQMQEMRVKRENGRKEMREFLDNSV